MASVRVEIADFQDGTLPLVCAVTGEPGATLRPASASSRGPSVVWFFIIGWLALFLSSTTVKGWVPYSEIAYATLGRRRRLAAGTAIGGVAATVLGLYLGDETFLPALVGGGMVALVLGLAFRAYTPGSIGARIDKNPRWIILHSVHPAFVAACEAAPARSTHSTGDDPGPSTIR
jgi:hypothetical protein